MTRADGSYHYIIPAFFDCIVELVARQVPFSIVFRTFGTDLGDIIEAFNEFCDGKVCKAEVKSRVP